MNIRKPYYIYNFEQINWMLSQDCCPEEVGKGMRGDLYLKFARTPKIEEVINIWKLKKRGM